MHKSPYRWWEHRVICDWWSRLLEVCVVDGCIVNIFGILGGPFVGVDRCTAKKYTINRVNAVLCGNGRAEVDMGSAVLVYDHFFDSAILKL
jgi:hypothetical protein